ncbi:MAG: hypothetical protein BGN96_15940 [Bacteroidales bacterium 45-6]|nr:MAG: hypothetical protein BGN96_15940 [Bacteroidales bacterium 45-6]
MNPIILIGYRIFSFYWNAHSGCFNLPSACSFPYKMTVKNIFRIKMQIPCNNLANISVYL